MIVHRRDHLPHLLIQIQVRIFHRFIVLRDKTLLRSMAIQKRLELLLRDDEIAGIANRA